MNLQMTTGAKAKDTVPFLYENLSYKIIRTLIEAHKELGPYAREKQVCDLFEKKFKPLEVPYKREVRIGNSGNVLDFIIADKVALEVKAVAFLTSAHYDQVKRYLHQTQLKLGILVNFRDKRLHPKRILNSNNLKQV